MKLGLEEHEEVVVVICGPVDSGKSTLLGVLSRGEVQKEIKDSLDDGNGKARKSILKFNHEKESGRTSSFHFHSFGFNKDDWGLERHQIITASDLCGHSRYLKTTITGICSSECDYAFVCVDRIQAKMNPMLKEHLKILLNLHIPFSIIINKIDLQTEEEIKHTIKTLLKYLKPLKRYIIKNTMDVDMISKSEHSGWVPFFILSCKTGYGLGNLLYYLSQLQKRKRKQDPPVFSVDSIFKVVGSGLVLSGQSGIDIQQGDKLYLGPFYDKSGFTFITVTVRSIHDNYKNKIMFLPKHTRGCICIRTTQKDNELKQYIKSGMMLSDKLENIPIPSFKFRARIKIFQDQHTTIKTGFASMCNIGKYRATAIFSFDDDSPNRAGDEVEATLTFNIPLSLFPETEFLFREGTSVGKGVVIGVR